MNLLNLGGVKKAGKSQPTPAKSPVSHGVSGSSKKRAPDDAETALQHTAFLDTVAEQFPRKGAAMQRAFAARAGDDAEATLPVEDVMEACMQACNQTNPAPGQRACFLAAAAMGAPAEACALTFAEMSSVLGGWSKLHAALESGEVCLRDVVAKCVSKLPRNEIDLYMDCGSPTLSPPQLVALLRSVLTEESDQDTLLFAMVVMEQLHLDAITLSFSVKTVVETMKRMMATAAADGETSEMPAATASRATHVLQGVIERSLSTLMRLTGSMADEELKQPMPEMAESVRALSAWDPEKDAAKHSPSMHIWRVAYELETQHKQSKAELDKLAGSHHAMQAQIQALEASKAKLEARRMELEHHLKDTLALLEDRKVQLETVTSESTSSVTRTAELERENMQLSTKTSELTTTISTLTITKTTLEVKQQEMERHLEKANQESELIKSQWENATSQMAARDEAMQELQAQLKESMQLLNDRKTKVEEAMAEAMQAQSDKAEVMQANLKLQTEKEKLAAEHAQFRLTTSSLESKMHEVEEALSKCKSDHAILLETLEQAQAQLTHREASLQATNTQLQAALALVEKRKQEMEATNSQLRLLASTNAEMQKQMYEFKTQSTDLTTTNNQLSLKTYSLEGRNQELSKQVSNLQNDLDLSKSELAQTQTLLQKRTNDLHEANLLQSALEQNRKENRDLNDEMYALKTRLKEMEVAAATAETSAKQLKLERDRALAEIEMERASNPMAVLDHQGKVLLWNTKAVLGTGYQREEVVGTEFASYAFDDSLREEVRQVIHNTLDGHGKKAMSIKMDCKLDECDVVWAMTVSGPGDITDLNIETVRLVVEVTNTRTVDKPVKLSYFRDEVDHAVQRAIRDGQLNIDIKRMERGIYVIGGARRNLTVQNSSLMVRVGGGYMPLGDFLAKYGLHEQGDRSSGLASMYARQLSLFTHAEDNHNQHSPAEELEQEDSAISSSTLGRRRQSDGSAGDLPSPDKLANSRATPGKPTSPKPFGPGSAVRGSSPKPGWVDINAGSTKLTPNNSVLNKAASAPRVTPSSRPASAAAATGARTPTRTGSPSRVSSKTPTGIRSSASTPVGKRTSTLSAESKGLPRASPSPNTHSAVVEAEETPGGNPPTADGNE